MEDRDFDTQKSIVQQRAAISSKRSERKAGMKSGSCNKISMGVV